MTRVKLKIPREVFSREDTTEYAVKEARAGVTYEYKRGTSMLNVVILWIFSCGIELGVIVLCLLPLRFILRRKVPRLFSYLLWGAVPVTVVFSLCTKLVESLPKKTFDFLDEKVPVAINENLFTMLKSFWTIGSIVVLVAMFTYFIWFGTYLIGSIRLRDNIYLCSRIDMAFSGGLIHPKIYLPTIVPEEYRELVILHEQVHVKRKDIWMRHLAIGLLALFWFQPVVWLAYYLYNNDMEEACDEAVLRIKGEAYRADYAKALYALSFEIKKVRSFALGFGNGAIKERIRHAARYKKENPKVRGIALVVCILFMVAAIPISWQVPRLVQKECRMGTMDDRSLSLETQSMDDRVIYSRE